MTSTEEIIKQIRQMSGEIRAGIDAGEVAPAIKPTVFLYIIDEYISLYERLKEYIKIIEGLQSSVRGMSSVLRALNNAPDEVLGGVDEPTGEPSCEQSE
jgi:hypothetical protein